MKKIYFPREVRGYEVDEHGLLHSSNYFRYMEEAECFFFRSLGLSFFKANSDIAFPRVSTYCKKMAPIKHGAQLLIHPELTKLSTSAITFTFYFYENEQLVGEGGFSIVCCRYNKEKGRLASTPLEDEMREKLSLYSTSKKPEKQSETKKEEVEECI